MPTEIGSLTAAAPVCCGHRAVLIKAYVHEVVISCASEAIAGHAPRHERQDMIFDPLHYLALIEQKPNALDQAASLTHLPKTAAWKARSEGSRGSVTNRIVRHRRPCFVF